MGEPEEAVPSSGVLFTFGKTKFAKNIPSKFWFKNDTPAFLSCGDEHTAIVTGNNKLYMFGSNGWGQLGLGSKSFVGNPTCVKEGGKLYATGGNNEGQLGLGDTEDRNTFHLISFFTSQHKVKQLSAGSNTSAVLTEDGELFMWGENSEGQIGLKDTTNVCVPHQVTIGKPISWISCGYYHSAFVTTEGELYTFGEPEYGKLGLPNELLTNHRTPQLVPGIPEKVIQVACGGEHTVVLTEKAVYTFGLGQFGQLGLGTSVFETSEPQMIDAFKDQRITYISCGESHTAVIADMGIIYTFGDDHHGKLGLGMMNFTNQFFPTLCSNFLSFTVRLVSCGGCHTLVFATPRRGVAEEVELEKRSESCFSAVASLSISDVTSGNILHGTSSARVRRREREKSLDSIQMTRMLLPPRQPVRFSPSSVPFPISTSNLLEEMISEEKGPMQPIEPGYFQDKMIKGKETDRTTDSESLGETTDVLNMTHVMSLNSDDKSLKLSPIQKQKKRRTVKKLKQHTAHTENDDGSDYESEEMFQKRKEGKTYKQFLAKGIYMIPTALTMEAFADEDTGSDSEQPGPQASADRERLQKEIFRCKSTSSVYPPDGKEIERESDGEHNQKDSKAEDTVSEKETELAAMAGLKDIRESEANIRKIYMFSDDLPNRDMNIEDEDNKYFLKESKRNKQYVTFDNEKGSVEEPDNYLEGESPSQQDTCDSSEQPESVESSSGDTEDDDIETKQILRYTRIYIEQGQEEENEHKISKFLAISYFKCDQMSVIQEEKTGVEEDSESCQIKKQETEANEENVEASGGKEDEEAEILSAGLTDRAEVREGKGKSGRVAERVPRGRGEGIWEEGVSGVGWRQSEWEEEEKDERGGEMEIPGVGEKDLEEEEKQEQKEREQGRQEERNKWVVKGKREEHGEEGESGEEEGKEEEGDREEEAGEKEEGEEEGEGEGEKEGERKKEEGEEKEGKEEEGEEEETEGEGEEEEGRGEEEEGDGEEGEEEDGEEGEEEDGEEGEVEGEEEGEGKEEEEGEEGDEGEEGGKEEDGEVGEEGEVGGEGGEEAEGKVREMEEEENRRRGIVEEEGKYQEAVDEEFERQGHKFSDHGEREDVDEETDERLVGEMLAVGGNTSVPVDDSSASSDNSVKKVLTPIEQDEEDNKKQAIHQYDENPKGSMCDRAKSSSSEVLGEKESAASENIKNAKKISLFQRRLLINKKSTNNNNEPLREIKPTGDQIAFKSNNKDANQNHMGQNHQDPLPPNMKRSSKSCTIL
ncbi:hypothetical protein MC885_000348 [Smutsia gigantea]|nr:hypothetical protein MC885_000348 [Smutsia gigantea]